CDEQGFILGPRVVALEQAVAAYVGSTHAVGVASSPDLTAATHHTTTAMAARIVTVIRTGSLRRRRYGRPARSVVEPGAIWDTTVDAAPLDCRVTAR
ncbi:MAG TPA: DegT/DnrJ/EryC1/StrS family aminotransferase, partial [Gordonia sp. (in: high G+C Gram-positive bacteria)]|nr:DegT/DnrJ/EryC1/StrS family aminotransferase [Gordonia sp. (in: high G+C Gram-positive bacteria)]